MPPAGVEAVESVAARAPLPPRDLPPHLARLCAAELLTVQRERELFQRLNYLKFQANRLRARLDPDHLDVDALSRAEQLLADADWVRNKIIEANTRLVISIVKKFATPELPFDELLSDGILTLMKAVDKFDYDRGFRFSTYAYPAITRCVYRLRSDSQLALRRLDVAAVDLAVAQIDTDTSQASERAWHEMRGALGQMLRRLDRRERLIIDGRFALGPCRESQTLQSLAREMGLSKERVRQLERRAVEKLHRMAGEFHIDESFGNSGSG